MTSKQGRKRTARTGLVVALGVALAVCVAPEDSEALTKTPPQNFNVRAQVYAGCSFSAANLDFSAYAINQSWASFAQTNWTINCPGVGTNGYTRPVRFTMSTTQGDFRMRSGSFGLNYLLCNDAACTQTYAQNVPGPPVTVNANPYTFTLHGEILGNQPARRGTYSQPVKVFLTY